jgi:hypothetical protein
MNFNFLILKNMFELDKMNFQLCKVYLSHL